MWRVLLIVTVKSTRLQHRLAESTKSYVTEVENEEKHTNSHVSDGEIEKTFMLSDRII